MIDNFIADPDRLVRKAAGRQFTVPSAIYFIRGSEPRRRPRIGSPVIETRLKDVLFEHFGLQGRGARILDEPLVPPATTPPEKLAATL